MPSQEKLAYGLVAVLNNLSLHGGTSSDRDAFCAVVRAHIELAGVNDLRLLAPRACRVLGTIHLLMTRATGWQRVGSTFRGDMLILHQRTSAGLIAFPRGHEEPRFIGAHTGGLQKLWAEMTSEYDACLERAQQSLRAIAGGLQRRTYDPAQQWQGNLADHMLEGVCEARHARQLVSHRPNATLELLRQLVGNFP